MSGAVDTVKKVAEVTALPILAPARAAFDLATEGTNPIRSVGGSVKKAVGNVKEVALQPFMEGAGMVPEAPLSIVGDDPAQVAADAEKKRQRAKRQAEIDILTDRPGRGGTILTDQFTYNV